MFGIITDLDECPMVDGNDIKELIVQALKSSGIVAQDEPQDEPLQVDEMEQILLDSKVVTYEELRLVVQLMGDSVETLEKVLYATTGYETFEQFLAEN